MNPNDPNLQIVEIVASALGDLRDSLVFVGGCAAGLLITDTGRPPVRATQDVDVIAEVASRADYYALADQLKTNGFAEYVGEVTCRWRYREILIDVMPTDETILGFTNRWYEKAIHQANQFVLPSGLTIKLISPPLLVATKVEAFYGRGHGDFESHDIEDIVTLVDGRPQLLEEIKHSSDDLREFLRTEIDYLLSQSEFIDKLRWHLLPDEANQSRIGLVIERLRQIAGI